MGNEYVLDNNGLIRSVSNLPVDAKIGDADAGADTSRPFHDASQNQRVVLSDEKIATTATATATVTTATVESGIPSKSPKDRELDSLSLVEIDESHMRTTISSSVAEHMNSFKQSVIDDLKSTVHTQVNQCLDELKTQWDQQNNDWKKLVESQNQTISTSQTVMEESIDDKFNALVPQISSACSEAALSQMADKVIELNQNAAAAQNAEFEKGRALIDSFIKQVNRHADLLSADANAYRVQLEEEYHASLKELNEENTRLNGELSDMMMERFVASEAQQYAAVNQYFNQQTQETVDQLHQHSNDYFANHVEPRLLAKLNEMDERMGKLQSTNEHLNAVASHLWTAEQQNLVDRQLVNQMYQTNVATDHALRAQHQLLNAHRAELEQTRKNLADKQLKLEHSQLISTSTIPEHCSVLVYKVLTFLIYSCGLLVIGGAASWAFISQLVPAFALPISLSFTSITPVSIYSVLPSTVPSMSDLLHITGVTELLSFLSENGHAQTATATTAALLGPICFLWNRVRQVPFAPMSTLVRTHGALLLVLLGYLAFRATSVFLFQAQAQATMANLGPNTTSGIGIGIGIGPGPKNTATTEPAFSFFRENTEKEQFECIASDYLRYDAYLNVDELDANLKTKTKTITLHDLNAQKLKPVSKQPNLKPKT